MSKSKKYAYAKVTVAGETRYHNAQEVAENRSKMNQAEYDKYNPRCICKGCNARLTVVRNNKGTYYFRQIDSHDIGCRYYEVKKETMVDRNIQMINYEELIQEIIGDIDINSDIVGRSQSLEEENENSVKPETNKPKPPRGPVKLFEEKKFVMCTPRTINRIVEVLYPHIHDGFETSDGFRANQILINSETAGHIIKTHDIVHVVIANVVRGIGRNSFKVFKSNKAFVYGVCPDIENGNKKIQYCLLFHDAKAREKYFKKVKINPRKMWIMAPASIIDENDKAVLIQLDIYNAQQIAIVRNRIRNNEVNR